MSRKKSGSTMSAARKAPKPPITKKPVANTPPKKSSTPVTDKARKQAIESIQSRLEAGERNKPASSSTPKTAKPPKAPRASAINIAAELIAKAGGKPMSAGELVRQMEAKGLWKSPGGKTPSATLSAAIGREIKVKGRESRFMKAGRGLYVAAGGSGAGGGPSTGA